MKTLPWEYDATPYWINPENGIHWYVDRSMTDWCSREYSDIGPLDATVFIVAQPEGDNMRALSRVLICNRTNITLADTPSIEALAIKIDALRLIGGAW